MLKALLLLALTANVLFAVVFGPRIYRVLRNDYYPVYARWWRMMGRRKVYTVLLHRSILLLFFIAFGITFYLFA